MNDVTLAERKQIEPLGMSVRQRSRLNCDRIHSHYRDLIHSGQLKSGSQLPVERVIAVEFGANRKTVREAMQRLADDSLIERRQGSGTYVLPNASVTVRSASHFETPVTSPFDALEARQAFEPGLYPFVVARATEKDFQRMREALASMRVAKDQIAFKKAGYAFHLEVARATRNPLLLGMYEMLVSARAKAGWGKLIQLNDREELRDQQLKGLTEICEALISRDATRATEVALRDISIMITAAAASPLDA